MDIDEIKIENAKSYFKIAQIVMILAGFLFAAPTASQTLAFNYLDSAKKSVDKTLTEIDQNYSQEIINITKSQLDLDSSLASVAKAYMDMTSTIILFASFLILVAVLLIFRGKILLLNLIKK